MRKTALAVLMLIVLMLSGCSALSFDSADIMCPPKATGDKAEIQKLIDKQTSGEYTLKYPKNGSNRSSIVMHDLDRDEIDEAIALYADKNGDHIHALFVSQIDDEYKVVSDILIEATTVDRIDFADIDSNGVYEILIGYSSPTSSQNTLNIFRYGEEVKKLDISCTYSSLVTGDFNYDKTDDILLISLYSGDIAAQAKLMIYNDGSLSELSSTELDSDITQLAGIQYGQISYGNYGAVIDGISTAGDYTTQVVVFDPTRPSLLNPLFSFSGYSSTRRSTQVCSVDYDKDELIDIPVCSLMNHNQGEDTTTVARRIDWSNLDTDSYSLSISKSAIICPADGYLLTMPNKWAEGVTARYNDKNRELTIYAYEYDGNDIKLLDTLLTIKSFYDEDYNKDDSAFIEFLRTGSTVYTYSIGSADNYLSISGEEVASLFSLVNQ